MMIFEDVWKQLGTIDRAAAFFLKAAGFLPDEGLSGAAGPLKVPAEDVFLRRFTENMPGSLALLHAGLTVMEREAAS